jgi:hypothetical protein
LLFLFYWMLYLAFFQKIGCVYWKYLQAVDTYNISQWTILKYLLDIKELPKSFLFKPFDLKGIYTKQKWFMFLYGNVGHWITENIRNSEIIRKPIYHSIYFCNNIPVCAAHIIIDRFKFFRLSRRSWVTLKFSQRLS